jgi:chromosome segregation ATPase
MPHGNPSPRMGKSGRLTMRSGEPDEELADLQRRFSALEDEAKTSTLASTMTTPRSVARQHRERSAAAEIRKGNESELSKLDEQITVLRRKHDELAHSNMAKRSELEKMTDRLKDLSKEAAMPSADDNQTLKEIKALEARLAKAVAKYEDAYEVRRTYEQIVKRLKEERIGFANQLEARELTLKAKEADYEELLLMSHDANQSKESAKSELTKFEALVSDERKNREKELQERRSLVAKKQEINQELERREKARRDSAVAPALGGEPKGGHAIGEADIEEEQEKIASYEAAFREIKEATGVADVNEVIQKFITQEETHKNLLSMTKESQAKIEALTAKKAAVQERVQALKFHSTSDDTPEAAGEAVDERKVERQRVKFERLTKVLVAVKAGIQHLSERLEGVKLDTPLLVLTDDNMVEVLAQCEARLKIVLEAIKQEEEALVRDLGEAALQKPFAPQSEPPVINNYRVKDVDGAEDAPSEEEFEEDLEEEVVDRDALKRQSGALVDKAAKKTKKKSKKKP